MDINFKLGDNTFNFRVCGIIRNKDKILVSVSDDKNYSSLIGGRVMAFEDSINALIREVKEESGFQAIYKKTVGFIENFYISRYGNVPYHEILIIHELEFLDQNIYDMSEIENLEEDNNAKFIWKNISDLRNENFKPKDIIDNIDCEGIYHIINKD